MLSEPKHTPLHIEIALENAQPSMGFTNQCAIDVLGNIVCRKSQSQGVWIMSCLCLKVIPIHFCRKSRSQSALLGLECPKKGLE